MRVSRARFITVFVLSAFVFQFVTNSLLGPEVRLFPANGNWFPGTGTAVAVLNPIKLILVGPLAPVFTDPDPAPPILVLAFAFYWALMALVLHFFISKAIIRK